MSVTNYIDSRWRLEGDQQRAVNVNVNVNVNPSNEEKKQFAYRVWREDFDKAQVREDGKKSEIKDTYAEIYQLIGLDNVFQGVWFQGVTQLAAQPQRGCRFSAIPIILSVLASLATIVGVHLKISKLEFLEKGLHSVRIHSKVLQSFISACERDGVDFDLDIVGDAAHRATLVIGNEFDKASAKLKRTREFSARVIDHHLNALCLVHSIDHVWPICLSA